MSASQNLLSVINALPDAALILSQERGKIVEANSLFLGHTGFTKDDLISAQLNRISFFPRQIRHGLVRLFMRVLRDSEGERTFRFRYVTSDKTFRDIVAYASRFSFEEEHYILFTFREAVRQETPGPSEEELESWKSCLRLGYEPYMEFRPAVPLLPPLESEDRTSFLKLAGGSLRIQHANNAAEELYGEQNRELTGKTFASFFNNGNDAFRFLDMLSVVGQMKAETAVTTPHGQIIQVEMNCMVRFGREGTISAVYCSQRDLSGYRRYEALLGGSRIEMDFIFNQPFLGLAYLTPSHPLERPDAEHVENNLDAMLRQILVVRANEAIFTLYGMDKTRFLMKPMAELFSNIALARQVLKELFVVRESSAAVYDVSGRTLKYVSVFRATFDDADRLNGILMATSKYDNGYKARHRSPKS